MTSVFQPKRKLQNGMQDTLSVSHGGGGGGGGARKTQWSELSDYKIDK